MILQRVRSLMDDRRDDLARLVTRQNGKPFEEAPREVGSALEYFGWFAEEARRTYGEIVTSPVRDKRLWVIHRRALREGSLARGSFYAPTVLLDVRDEMRVCREEIFGPVAPVLTFRTEAEVIDRANHTEYGLAAYLYARGLGRVTRVAEALEYGLVSVNDAAGYTHEVPFGGFKESGLGREGGRQGIYEYMEVKSVVVNLPRSG